MLTDQTILITGGTGTWGQELITHLQPLHPKDIRVHSSRDGDITDRAVLSKMMDQVDVVFHFAAKRDVVWCEANPEETFRVNVDGTKNVILCAKEHGVPRVVFSSTTQAANPTNVYGKSKRIGEELMTEAGFVSYRAGNILGSPQSVVPRFKKQIQENNTVEITDKKMSRFFSTTKDIIEFIIKTVEKSNPGEILIPKLQAYSIEDLALAVIKCIGNTDTQIEYTGKKPGEVLEDRLLANSELAYTIDRGNYFAIQKKKVVEKQIEEKDIASSTAQHASQEELINILKSESLV